MSIVQLLKRRFQLLNVFTWRLINMRTDQILICLLLALIICLGHILSVVKNHNAGVLELLLIWLGCLLKPLFKCFLCFSFDFLLFLNLFIEQHRLSRQLIELLSKLKIKKLIFLYKFLKLPHFDQDFINVQFIFKQLFTPLNSS